VAEAKSKLICPNCQVEMNHHSDKLVYATDLPQEGAIDPNPNPNPNLWGFIEEFHT
jgi:hypothetical protein